MSQPSAISGIMATIVMGWTSCFAGSKRGRDNRPRDPVPFPHRLSVRQAEQFVQRLDQRVSASGAGVGFLGKGADRRMQ